MKNLLVVDLAGKMAHFRKFYTNSSSLSYSFPPRTVVAGMFAAVLGIERDRYYEDFSVEKAKIAVRIMKPLRSVMQTVNYISVKELRYLDGSGGGTQVPIEIILPEDIDDLLLYRLFLLHIDTGKIMEIYSLLKEKRTKIPLYFGITEFPAWIYDVDLYTEGDFEIRNEKGSEILINTVVPIHKIKEIGVFDNDVKIHKDRIPIDFAQGRILKYAATVLWEARGLPVRLKIDGEVFETDKERGVFLE